MSERIVVPVLALAAGVVLIRGGRSEFGESLIDAREGNGFEGMERGVGEGTVNVGLTKE